MAAALSARTSSVTGARPARWRARAGRSAGWRPGRGPARPGPRPWSARPPHRRAPSPRRSRPQAHPARPLGRRGTTVSTDEPARTRTPRPTRHRRRTGHVPAAAGPRGPTSASAAGWRRPGPPFGSGCRCGCGCGCGCRLRAHCSTRLRLCEGTASGRRRYHGFGSTSLPCAMTVTGEQGPHGDHGERPGADADRRRRPLTRAEEVRVLHRTGTEHRATHAVHLDGHVDRHRDLRAVDPPPRPGPVAGLVAGPVHLTSAGVGGHQEPLAAPDVARGLGDRVQRADPVQGQLQGGAQHLGRDQPHPQAGERAGAHPDRQVGELRTGRHPPGPTLRRRPASSCSACFWAPGIATSASTEKPSWTATPTPVPEVSRASSSTTGRLRPAGQLDRRPACPVAQQPDRSRLVAVGRGGVGAAVLVTAGTSDRDLEPVRGQVLDQAGPPFHDGHRLGERGVEVEVVDLGQRGRADRRRRAPGPVRCAAADAPGRSRTWGW